MVFSWHVKATNLTESVQAVVSLIILSLTPVFHRHTRSFGRICQSSPIVRYPQHLDRAIRPLFVARSSVLRLSCGGDLGFPRLIHPASAIRRVPVRPSVSGVRRPSQELGLPLFIPFGRLRSDLISPGLVSVSCTNGCKPGEFSGAVRQFVCDLDCNPRCVYGTDRSPLGAFCWRTVCFRSVAVDFAALSSARKLRKVGDSPRRFPKGVNAPDGMVGVCGLLGFHRCG